MLLAGLFGRDAWRGVSAEIIGGVSSHLLRRRLIRLFGQ
jgi:hypothetical protein